MKILVVGGAGFIGSHMVKMLWEKGCDITILDDLSSGHRDAVMHGDFIYGNCGDKNLIGKLLKKPFDAVMHFASFIQVAESVKNPSAYYLNNVVNTLTLMDAMIENRVKRFIFSSTAATFGEPLYTPIDEKHPQNPINPYGRSKLIIEQILKDYEKAYDFRSVCLRYFNAAGADADCELGERHDPETHLIPLLLQVASGIREDITVFGSDYDTPDGTCIRDYVHVSDICEAHWLSLISLINGSNSNLFNLGNGDGFSVNEVIESVERVTNKKVSVIYGDRRFGDPAKLISDSNYIRELLGWTPKYPNLDEIVQHAWNWEVSKNSRALKS